MAMPARISGRALRVLLSAVKRTPAATLVVRSLRSDLGIEALSALPAAARDSLPQSVRPLRARPRRARPSRELPLPTAAAWPATSRQLGSAYAQGLSPEDVVRRAFDGAQRLAAESPTRGCLLYLDEQAALEAARASANRHAQGSALGPLDGIVLAVKEEVDVARLPTRLGTNLRPCLPAEQDAVVVSRLRAAGAIILGNTPMTEYGLSPLGANIHRQMPRNAQDPGRLAGGSSTGSAVAVATGVAPVCLGADGGGSIRIPAALNGVFGLKPTYGRLPLSGHGLSGGSSLVHLGPLGSSSHDLAVFLEATAGGDPGDTASLDQPPLEPDELQAALAHGVAGLRIGVDEREWAAAPSDVAAPARDALRTLEREGATLVPVCLGLASHAPAIGYTTLGLEMASALTDARAHLDAVGPDVALLLLGLGAFGPYEYLDAQRLRAALRREVAEQLAHLDAIALPSTARSAPPVSDREASTGFVDPGALSALCRYAFLANLTGLPAISIPVGTAADGLPVGLQLVADAWDEGVLLAAAAHLERLGVARVLEPEGAVHLLR